MVKKLRGYSYLRAPNWFNVSNLKILLGIMRFEISFGYSAAFMEHGLMLRHKNHAKLLLRRSANMLHHHQHSTTLFKRSLSFLFTTSRSFFF